MICARVIDSRTLLAWLRAASLSVLLILAWSLANPAQAQTDVEKASTELKRLAALCVPPYTDADRIWRDYSLLYSNLYFHWERYARYASTTTDDQARVEFARRADQAFAELTQLPGPSDLRCAGPQRAGLNNQGKAVAAALQMNLSEDSKLVLNQLRDHLHEFESFKGLVSPETESKCSTNPDAQKLAYDRYLATYQKAEQLVGGELLRGGSGIGQYLLTKRYLSEGFENSVFDVSRFTPIAIGTGIQPFPAPNDDVFDGFREQDVHCVTDEVSAFSPEDADKDLAELESLVALCRQPNGGGLTEEFAKQRYTLIRERLVAASDDYRKLAAELEEGATKEGYADRVKRYDAALNELPGPDEFACPMPQDENLIDRDSTDVLGDNDTSIPISDTPEEIASAEGEREGDAEGSEEVSEEDKGIKGSLSFSGLGDDFPSPKGKLSFSGLSFQRDTVPASMKFVGLSGDPELFIDRVKFVGMGDPPTPNVDEAPKIFGNWRATWTNDEYLTPGLMTINDGEDGGVEIAGTRIRGNRVETISASQVTGLPGGGYKIAWNFGHLGYWGGESILKQTSANQISGEWGYRCEEPELKKCWTTGTSNWVRVLPSFKQHLPLSDHPEGLFGALSTVPLPQGPKGSFNRSNPIRLFAPDTEPGENGWLGHVHLAIYGDDIFGPQGIAVTGPSGLTFSKYSYICELGGGEGEYQLHWSQNVCERQGGIAGLYVRLNVYEDATEADYDLVIQGETVPIYLDID